MKSDPLRQRGAAGARLERLAATQGWHGRLARQDASCNGRRCCSADGVVGSVGVNYLPVNSAPVVDDVVVVPGARLNPQTDHVSSQQTVNIALPIVQPGCGGHDSMPHRIAHRRP